MGMTVDEVKRGLLLLNINDFKVTGKSITTKCPFRHQLHETHTDNKPSFFISKGKDGNFIYHCFTCKSKGMFRNLNIHLKKVTGVYSVPFEEFMTSIGRESSKFYNKPKETIKSESDSPLPQPRECNKKYIINAWDDKAGLSYLIMRGVSKQACEVLQLKIHNDRIWFPIIDNELIRGWVGRTIVKDVYPKVSNEGDITKSDYLLGFNLYKSGKPIIVYEGLFALATAITNRVQKFFNPVAIMGSYISDKQVDILAKTREEIILCLDYDKAGITGMYGSNYSQGAVEKFMERDVNVRSFIYPTGKKDPDLLINKDYENYLDIRKGTHHGMGKEDTGWL